MGTLTVRNLDETVKRKLRERAAGRGMSMENSARSMLNARKPAHVPEERSWRLRASLEDLLSLSIKPEEPFDLKAVSDEMWEDGLR